MALLAASVSPADLAASSRRQGDAATSPRAPRGRGRACCGRRMRRVLAYLPSDGAGLRSQVASGVATATRAFASLHSDLKAQLSDPDLLKHQSYVGGRWIDSQSGQTIEVGRPRRRRRRRRRRTEPTRFRPLCSASLPALLLAHTAALAAPTGAGPRHWQAHRAGSQLRRRGDAAGHCRRRDPVQGVGPAAGQGARHHPAQVAAACWRLPVVARVREQRAGRPCSCSQQGPVL